MKFDEIKNVPGVYSAEAYSGRQKTATFGMWWLFVAGGTSGMHERSIAAARVVLLRQQGGEWEHTVLADTSHLAKNVEWTRRENFQLAVVLKV